MRILLGTVVVAAWSLSVASGAHAQGDMDCKDFGSWREAQEFYERNGPGDPHDLDRDRDGIACESLR